MRTDALVAACPGRPDLGACPLYRSLREPRTHPAMAPCWVYDPTLRRFLPSDPLGSAGNVHSVSYIGGYGLFQLPDYDARTTAMLAQPH